jgi:hypothetical protein
VLRDEINRELRIVGEDKLEDIERLYIGKFDSTVYNSTAKFLSSLKQFYLVKMNRQQKARDEMVARLTSTPELTKRFERLRNTYQNQAVSDEVRNIRTQHRIVEYKGRLIQKMYPIYMDEHKPKHFLDYTSNFYQPTKYFAGYIINTLVFNICVIWLMTLFLFFTLYFDLFKKFVMLFERRKLRRKDRN